MLKDLKIQLSLNLDRECLEQMLIFWRQDSSLLQFSTVPNDRGERGTHLGQRVINPGFLGDIEDLDRFHVGLALPMDFM